MFGALTKVELSFNSTQCLAYQLHKLGKITQLHQLLRYSLLKFAHLSMNLIFSFFSILHIYRGTPSSPWSLSLLLTSTKQPYTLNTDFLTLIY